VSDRSKPSPKGHAAATQAHFDGAVSAAGGHIRAARVARKKGPDGKPLSAGYGFVECSSEDVAKLVLAKLQARALCSKPCCCSCLCVQI
jgi:hypothetical protein